MDSMTTLDDVSAIAPKTCEFCGRPLKTTSVTVGGKRYEGLPCYASCGCTASINRLESTERRARKTDWKSRYLRAGIAMRYIDAEVECSGYAKTVMDGAWLYIHGLNGDGKTLLASCIAKSCIRAGISVRFEYAKDLMTERFTADYEVMKRITDCDVLVIDDLGKEAVNAWAVSCMFEVLDKRYRDLKPVIVTTNYDRNELGRRFAECGETTTAKAIVSRLCDDCLKVELGNEDRRTR